MALLFVVHFARVISDSVCELSQLNHLFRQLSDNEASIQNFPFSLNRSTHIDGTVRKGHLNVYYASFEQSNVLDLLRIRVRLHNFSRSTDISNLLLQVTCYRPIHAISFALPTKNGDVEDGVVLPDLDVKTAEPFSDTGSIHLIILITTNLNDILAYSISVKIYDRANYNIILHAPKFSRALLNQKVSAVMPIAFRVQSSLQMVKITVKSDNSLCAFLIVQNYSVAFLRSEMLALNSFTQVIFTRKASLTLLTNSPLHVFVMMDYDRTCSTFVHAHERNRKKKFDIEFSSLQSTSSYPLVVMAMFYLTLSIVFLTYDRLVLRLPITSTSQRETDVPLIVLSDESSSSIPSSSTHQEMVPVKDSHNILVHTEMDKDKLESVKDIALVKTTERRTISPDSNAIVMRTLESNWNICIRYCASLPFVLQYFYKLLVDQMTLMNNNLDACYHNMECSVALGPFQTFNHIYSNVGYLLLGFLFLIFISHRCKYWKHHRYIGYSYCSSVFLNVSLMMCLEAVASAFYHICPNPRTFHNDTLFVEIILILLMVRFYFVRRGGVSLNRIFESIICAISFHFVGNILKDNFFTLGILLTSGLLLSVAFHCHLLLDSQSFDETIPSRDWREWLRYYWQMLIGNETDKSSALKKRLLACIIACNIALALLFGIGLLQKSYVTLHITVLNAAGYFIYYISCKIVNGETILKDAYVHGVVALLLWIAAFYFFSRGKNDWTLTVAENRAIAEECILFQYFDHHDIWHFISSLASFFSLIAIAVLDDDIAISHLNGRSISTF